jgi:ferredoxin-NADP reductase
MSSKYLLSWHKKHIFNPAAIAVILSSYLFNYSASWWVGDVTMAVFVAIGSFLIIRKTRREDMTFYFLLTTLGLGIILGMFVGNDPLLTVKKTLLYSPVLFFAGVMLTEPLTTPPTKLKQIIYGVIAGILMVPQVHIGALYFTPELALVLANIYAFSVSSKGRKLLKLKRIDMLTQSIYDFVFAADSKFNYLPGQYIEYTLKVAKADSRGNRRYFTLASSPTEDEVLLGVKFYDKPSSFKETLLNLRPTDTITAFQVAGDFVLPQNKSKKLVFIAGGIGITPFRSMTKYLLDKNEPRDIILLYANKTNADIVYKSIFDEAEKTLGLKAHYIETDTVGRLSKELITTFVADAQERTFYISGPQAMVTTVKSILNDMNIPDHRIVSDFFPGFA